MSLLAIGSVAFDALETPYGKTDKIIGGAGTYISLSASYFKIPVNLVAVVGEDFPQEYIQLLENKGINTNDASQQATQGDALSFIEESEPGDLAFFDNEEGKIIHVGIIMDNNYIIHSSGKVRIDRLDHLGIYNAETNRHTHKLRVIKKMI
eukprot:gene20649-40488_t